MQTITDISIFDHDKILENPSWNLSDQKEPLLHRIHAYPAKFPPFLVQKLIKYFEESGKDIGLVADTFCGCGTSALESLRLGKDFWGCDINPVATLIARTKSRIYSPAYLKDLYKEIQGRVFKSHTKVTNFYHKNQRINYWFEKETIDELFKILQAIKKTSSNGKYQDFFLTAFSNILKPCSKWLTKSIKPQIDPQKTPAAPLDAFDKQIKMMIRAVEEIAGSEIPKTSIRVVNGNLLNLKIEHSFADAVITSPPYVTSYEYADLHQLSTLWLGYATDYRRLREGSIGSERHSADIEEIYEKANRAAKHIYDKLCKVDDSKARSVLKYFYDLDLAVQKIKKFVKVGGMAAFVIGNTSYKGVHIDNAKSLTQSLLDHNFKNIKILKRRISYKILTPYRNRFGRFSSHSRGRKVYSHEYILIGER